MTILYEVQVERRDFGHCESVRVASSEPILACEAAERIAAERLAGDDWAKIVHRFFAYSVRELTAADVAGWSSLNLPAA